MKKQLIFLLIISVMFSSAFALDDNVVLPPENEDGPNHPLIASGVGVRSR